MKKWTTKSLRTMKRVELLSHGMGAGGTDPRGAGICDTPEVSDAQRDEWLLKTELLNDN